MVRTIDVVAPPRAHWNARPGSGHPLLPAPRARRSTEPDGGKTARGRGLTLSRPARSSGGNRGPGRGRPRSVTGEQDSGPYERRRTRGTAGGYAAMLTPRSYRGGIGAGTRLDELHRGPALELAVAEAVEAQRTVARMPIAAITAGTKARMSAESASRSASQPSGRCATSVSATSHGRVTTADGPGRGAGSDPRGPAARRARPA
jgi:hypothetical protein